MRMDSNTGKYADVPVRVKSWGYIILVFAVMLLHPLSMSVITVLLSLYALREYFAMTAVRNSILLFPAYSIAIPVFVALHTNNYRLFVLSIVSYIAVLLIISMLFARERSQCINIAAGIVFCVFSIGHLAFIRALDNPPEQISGLRLALFIVILTELNDVSQYLTGKIWGKRKIAPRISPNKTVEGFLGGIVCSALLANVAGWFLIPQKGVFVYTVSGILIAVLGFCGDILMSLVKRKNKVKDTGNLIPGHGGLLDRMDSLLLVLPAFYWTILFLYFKP